MRAGGIISNLDNGASGIVFVRALEGEVVRVDGARVGSVEGASDVNKAGLGTAFALRGAGGGIGGGGRWCGAGSRVGDSHACTSSPPEPPSEI